MTFDEKVKIIRSLPSFKVAPINEVRAVAFAVTEGNGDIVLSDNPLLTLSHQDVEQILREYPHLAPLFN
jgi:hypothetical protein